MQLNLQPLVFGNIYAQTDLSAHSLEERFHAIHGWSPDYRVIGAKDQFANRSVSATLNGLKLTHTSHTPLETSVTSEGVITLIIPFYGSTSQMVLNGYALSYAPGQNALFVPEGHRVGKGGARSVLILEVDPSRLQQTASIMLGEDNPVNSGINLQLPQELSLRRNGFAVDAVFKQYCGVIDQCYSFPQALNELKLDESFYRAMVLLFQQNRLTHTEVPEPDKSVSRRKLDTACEYAMANFDKTITLTDLEQVSGLSARTLQTLFQKQYQCTPMEWIKGVRLDFAYSQLSKPHWDTTVSNVASANGFVHFGKFSRFYLQRFGEHPSETLAKAKL